MSSQSTVSCMNDGPLSVVEQSYEQLCRKSSQLVANLEINPTQQPPLGTAVSLVQGWRKLRKETTKLSKECAYDSHQHWEYLCFKQQSKTNAVIQFEKSGLIMLTKSLFIVNSLRS